MGCGCSKNLDTVAPPHKPYLVPPAASASTTLRLDKPAVSAPVHGACLAPASNPLAILDEGSELQGLRFAPWGEEDEDIARNFGFQGALASCKDPFSDADGLLQLSDRQREALHVWRRLPELIRAGEGRPEPTVLESTPTSEAICQGLVGDCSFLSALSTLADYERRFKEPVLSSIIHPKDVDAKARDAQQRPVYNEYGQYGCRLFFNGTARKVIVDDKVPVRRDGKLLCAHSARPRELWVTLLEKSFVKLMGSSYDMQGSNPGTDIFHLTGWVPETIPLNGDSDAAQGSSAVAGEAISAGGRRAGWDEVFAEAADGYHTGRCVVCVGTSELADAVPNGEARRLGHIEGVSVSTGLVSRHAYPVLDCRQVGRHRLLRLKNPWGRVRWRGRFSPGDAAWAEVLSGPILAGAGSGPANKGEAPGGAQPAEEAAVDDGRFWIEWDDVVRHFSHLYLCWAPRALGLHQVEVHSRWDPEPHFSRSALPDDTHLTAFNPQFLLRLNEPLPGTRGPTASIWVLLSRHVRVRSEIAAKYVAAHLYKGHSRLCCPDAPLEQGIYSNGECALVKLHSDAAPGEQEFIITVSQHAHKSMFNFTLQVYTSSPATLTPLPPLVPEAFAFGAVDGRWTPESAGGCSNNIWRFFQNPQWRFEVPEGGIDTLFIFLECPAEHSVNVRFFTGTTAQPETLRAARSSGAYRQGCCYLHLTDVAAGPYVAVVSTFRPALCGTYRLAWHSPRSIKLRPQPHPFAAPSEPLLEAVIKKVVRGREVRFRLQSLLQAPTLVSVRVQSACKEEGHRPALGLFCGSDVAADGVGGPFEQLAPCELLKTSYADSYYASSGGVVILVAELVPGTPYELQVFVPQKEREDEADLYVISDGRLALWPLRSA